MPAARRRVGQSPPNRSIVSTTTGSNCTAGRLPACSSLADRSRFTMNETTPSREQRIVSNGTRM
eukprot:scaffold57652_cov35-Attheya_sp.AAC.1